MGTQEINSREREASLRKTGNIILPIDLTQENALINRNTQAHTNKNTSRKQTNELSKKRIKPSSQLVPVSHSPFLGPPLQSSLYGSLSRIFAGREYDGHVWRDSRGAKRLE